MQPDLPQLEAVRTRLGHVTVSTWSKCASDTVPLSLPVVLTLLIAATAVGPQTAQWAALACIILLGVPHGALDGEIARPYLKPRYGRAWFAVFALPYLGLAALVLLAWHLAPLITLAVFLLASVHHFGTEDVQAGASRGQGAVPLAAASRGGLAVALPVLLHPTATARFLGVVAQTGMPHIPGWLLAPCLLWCPLMLCWATLAARRRQWRDLADAGLVAALFACLAPLQAFAAYFVCLHGPRHIAAVIRQGRAPRVATLPAAILRAAPVTALTFLIGAALWGAYQGPPADRLLTLTIQGLAALTLPHLLLELASEHADASRVRRRPFVSSGSNNCDGARTGGRARQAERSTRDSRRRNLPRAAARNTVRAHTSRADTRHGRSRPAPGSEG